MQEFITFLKHNILHCPLFEFPKFPSTFDIFPVIIFNGNKYLKKNSRKLKISLWKHKYKRKNTVFNNFPEFPRHPQNFPKFTVLGKIPWVVNAGQHWYKKRKITNILWISALFASRYNVHLLHLTWLIAHKNSQSGMASIPFMKFKKTLLFKVLILYIYTITERLYYNYNIWDKAVKRYIKSNLSRCTSFFYEHVWVLYVHHTQLDKTSWTDVFLLY